MVFVLSLEGRDEFGNRCLHGTRRDSNNHEECHQGIELPIIDRGKGPDHEEVVQKIKEVEEANADKHQHGMPEKLVFRR